LAPMEFEFVILLLGLFCVAVLYSSVGHGGASGYLAIMSMTSYGMMESEWLKHNVWVLNLVVAGIAFAYYKKGGFHDFTLTLPFIIASIPMAFLGGYISIDDYYYDVLLSFVLIWASWRLWSASNIPLGRVEEITFKQALPWGAGIGFISGVIGVGGGIFLSPILLLKGWATPKGAAATSALFIWVNSFSGLIGAGVSGGLMIDWDLLPYFVSVVLIGGFIGSIYGTGVANQLTIKKVLVIVLLLAAMRRIMELLN
jgi:uncharacterized membrane protein YfcA